MILQKKRQSLLFYIILFVSNCEIILDSTLIIFELVFTVSTFCPPRPNSNYRRPFLNLFKISTLPPKPGSPFSIPTLPVSSRGDLALDDKMEAKNEVSVLIRQADSEGWSDNKLTEALRTYAAKRTQSECKPASVSSAGSSNKMGSEQAQQFQKRQETVRIIRQAEIEGWSDEKLVAALRLRNSIHYELLGRVPRIENS